uniref:Uncharacterized protein n=1 Tax=Amphimedon queenslandica TaxID=400682 RepID=A0A1X7U837_AMPQE
MVNPAVLLVLYLFYLYTKRRSSYQLRLQKFQEAQRRQSIIFHAVLLLMHRCRRYMIKRSIWVRARSGDWWNSIVRCTFNDDDWRENFRVSKSTFAVLCNCLRNDIAKSNTKLRKAIPTEKRVAITLWKLATNCEYRTIGHLFGVARGTACVIVNDVCKAIVKNLFSKYIRLPKGERLSDIVKNFEKKWGYPQCFGAIDGTHLPIIAPSECAKNYYNRKGFHSILMQGLVDCNYCFTDIYIGWPGSVHDARVFSHSKLFTLGQTGQLVLKNQSRVIHNVVVPLHIVADPAYPLLTWVMKPFSDNGKLSADQINFNYHLSKARVVTENAFGRMKGRWRCLMKSQLLLNSAQ